VKTPQIPLAMPVPAEQRFDTFVGSAEACRAAAASASGESADWLFLCGPAGCGKTHLLMAAVAAAQAAGRSARYLPMRVLAGSLTLALPGQERADVVCLDELDRIGGDPADQEGLFHFHNRARAAGTRVIYAARAAPSLEVWSLPDLVSRLNQCSRFLLSPLGDGDRRELLQRRALQRGLTLEPAVLDYLFRRVGRDLGTLTGILDRLDRASLAVQRRITVPLVRAVLGEPGA
jgi:DnaA family protein